MRLTSLNDLAVKKTDRPAIAIGNWMRNRNTVALLGIWEISNNPDFKVIEFDDFRKNAGLNSFTLTPSKWIEATGAIGIRVKRGRHGGTFAHVDLAMDFAAWISPEFRLHVFQEYRRLKADETSRLNLEWQKNRLFASLNYRLHTDAVKEMLPADIDSKLSGIQYAREAEMLNLAVFGFTAKDWKLRNPNLDGNPRDYASATQLLILNNLEVLNATFIQEGIDRDTRYKKLYESARRQEKTFAESSGLKQIERPTDDRT